MIREILDFYLTPATSVARRLGYLYSSIAMARRYERCSSAWGSHLNACRTLVLDHLPKDPKRVLILGSGLMVEMPLTELLLTGAEIHLVDMVHPRRVLALKKKHNQIHLHNWDVTGLTGQIQVQNRLSDGLPNPKAKQGLSSSDQLGRRFAPPAVDFDFDFVISANLLSQLALEPIQFQQKIRGAPLENHECLALIQKLQTDHWSWLQKFKGRKILYSDIERSYRDPSGRLIEKVASVQAPEVWPEDRRWEWQIAPLGEESREYSMSMTVAGYVKEP